jgi:thiamine-monophosphate kinase
MNELDFVTALRSLPLHPGALGLRDDCALIEIGDETLVINKDMMAEDTHFLPSADLGDVAWKLVALNLSDIASKGAEPIGVLLGYALGGEGDTRFLEGLADALTEYNVPLLGGDTIATTGASTFCITAIGRATHTPVPSRTSAQAGEALFVTGPLGRAMLGFEGDPAHREAFNRPRPRVAEGMALAPYVGAMMDISDGLLLDAYRMAEASDVTVIIDPQLVPVAQADRFDDCIRWGDDYELLFSASYDAELPIDAVRIGLIEEAGDAAMMLGASAFNDPDALGYRHG